MSIFRRLSVGACCSAQLSDKDFFFSEDFFFHSQFNFDTNPSCNFTFDRIIFWKKMQILITLKYQIIGTYRTVIRTRGTYKLQGTSCS